MSAKPDCTLHYDGKAFRGRTGIPLIEFLAQHGVDLPHVCYHPALGPIESCDVCWVELDGDLVRGCAL